MSYHIVRNLKQYKYFILQQSKVLLLNDFKKSFLGSAWLLITPLVTVAVWIILHSAGILNPGEIKGSYAAFVLLGTTIWNLFFDMYWSSSRLITSYGNLMIMKKFPIEALILVIILVTSIRFGILLALTSVALLLMSTSISLWILALPILLIPLALTGLSLGLFTSLIRVVAADLANVIDMGIKVLLYLTPVIYATHTSGKLLQYINTINPITYLLGFPRDQVLGENLISLHHFLATAILFTLLFFVSFRIVKRQSPFLLEKLILS